MLSQRPWRRQPRKRFVILGIPFEASSARLRGDRSSHLPLFNLLQWAERRSRRFLRVSSAVFALLVVSLALSACGKSFYFAGRPLPPSGILNRVLIAAQISGQGSLSLVDGLYDVRHNYNNTVGGFPIGGYSPSALPFSIQNLPAEEAGLVFSNAGSGSSAGLLTSVNYATETSSSLLPPPGSNSVASSIFASTSRGIIVAAQQQSRQVEVFDASTTPTLFLLNLPGVYRVSVSPGGTLALAFVENQSGQNSVYSVVHLTNAQQQAAAALPFPQNVHFPLAGVSAEDCEPQNLPQYCIYPVTVAGTAPVDRPIKALFSPDGASAYIIDCGPECGGQTAGLTQIPLKGLNTNIEGPAGIGLTTTNFIPVPGGVTDGLFNGSTLYVAGQRLVPADGLFTGELSVVNLSNNTVSAPIAISDGTHQRMVLADDTTLWIGSSNCQSGERYKQAQAGATVPYGCMTMFNTATNTVTTIESYKGDGTGIAALTTLHKVYTAEGGQVYIYSTRTGGALDNANVAVQGTVVDVAYMDAPDDSDNTWY